MYLSHSSYFLYIKIAFLDCVSYADINELALGNTNYIRLTSITDKRTTNNVMESFSGTVRERLNVVNGMFGNYYNRIKIFSASENFAFKIFCEMGFAQLFP